MQVKKQVFPYGFKFVLGSGKVFSFPAVEVSLFGNKCSDEFSFLVLIDSGAEISLFTKSDAELLGIDLEKGEAIEINSASGDNFSAFVHFVKLKIGQALIDAEIAFSEKDDTPRLLGRHSIFSDFFIIFDETEKKTILIPREDKKAEKWFYGKNI